MLSRLVSLGAKALPAWVMPCAIAILFVTWSTFCFVKGMARVQEKWDQEQLVNKLTAAVEYQRVETVVERVRYEIVPQIRVVEKQAKTIVKKVPVYVPQEADSNCTVNNGFVWLHEEARSGVHVPHDSARIVDAAPGVGLADVATVVASNYGKFRTMKLQCQGLLDIVKSLPQRKN